MVDKTQALLNAERLKSQVEQGEGIKVRSESRCSGRFERMRGPPCNMERFRG